MCKACDERFIKQRDEELNKVRLEPAAAPTGLVVVNRQLLAACELVLNRRPIGGTANDISLAEGDLKIIKKAVANARKLIRQNNHV